MPTNERDTNTAQRQRYNIIGNTPYRDITDKTYMQLSTDKAKAVAEILEEQGVKFSGRINGENATITISKEDTAAYRSALDAVEKAQKEQPLYLQSYDYASEHGELDAMRKSHDINLECVREIKREAEIWDKNLDLDIFTNSLAEKYGADRVMYVISRTIQDVNDVLIKPEVKDIAAQFEYADRGTAHSFTHLYVSEVDPLILGSMLISLDKSRERQNEVAAEKPTEISPPSEEKADKPPERQSIKDRLKDITDGIEKGIKDLFQSDKYAEYLRTMSRFHNYSFNNVMLIHAQKPDATRVAGFNKWRDQFSRHVKRGEKGIQIIAPMPYKYKKEVEKLDPDTGAPMLDKDGNVIMEEKIVSVPKFKVVSVFDVSQTEGKPLPELAANLTGDVKNFDIFMEALRRTSPVPIEFKPLPSNTDGYFHLVDQNIVLREGMSEIQTASAGVHEVTHSILHNYEKEKAEIAAGDETAEQPVKKDQRTREVEAESVSYAVCQYYGIETAENSFGYIASWSASKELKELRSSLETINKTAAELIDNIDRNYREICQERGIDMSADKPDQAQETAEPKEQTAAEVPEQSEREKLYIADDNTYIHLQTSDEGYDYTLYDVNSMRQTDGGQLDEPSISLSEALSKVCEMHGIDEQSIKEAPTDMIETLQNAAVETAHAEPESVPAAPEVELKEDMPDPSYTVNDMIAYGYTDEEMLPLSKDRAIELIEQDITVYMLYGDNTEAMAFDAEEIRDHDGLFGITKEDWEAVKGTQVTRDIEKEFMDAPTDAFMICQLKDEAPRELMFTAMKDLKEPPSMDNYEAVYVGELEQGADTIDALENIYTTFNMERPADFKGHSLSVSDIVALKQGGEISYHFCDSFGFKRLDLDNPENYLKNAEMAMEDDYGMIDGIINNGEKKPTVEELEQQARSGTPISLMDLADAIHRENAAADKAEEKPSILSQLKTKPTQQEDKKDAPKKSAEMEI